MHASRTTTRPGSFLSRTVQLEMADGHLESSARGPVRSRRPERAKGVARRCTRPPSSPSGLPGRQRATSPVWRPFLSQSTGGGSAAHACRRAFGLRRARTAAHRADRTGARTRVFTRDGRLIAAVAICFSVTARGSIPCPYLSPSLRPPHFPVTGISLHTSHLISLITPSSICALYPPQSHTAFPTHLHYSRTSPPTQF